MSKGYVDKFTHKLNTVSPKVTIHFFISLRQTFGNQHLTVGLVHGLATDVGVALQNLHLQEVSFSDSTASLTSFICHSSPMCCAVTLFMESFSNRDHHRGRPATNTDENTKFTASQIKSGTVYSDCSAGPRHYLNSVGSSESDKKFTHI